MAHARELQLKLSELASGYVEEDDFVYYAASIPPSAQAIKVIITPIFGDPDVYMSFYAEQVTSRTQLRARQCLCNRPAVLRRGRPDTPTPLLALTHTHTCDARAFRLPSCFPDTRARSRTTQQQRG